MLVVFCMISSSGIPRLKSWEDVKSRCVFDYGGECQSAVHNKGKTGKVCKTCKGYTNMRVAYDRTHLQRLIAERRKISAEIAILAHDIAESERC